MKLKQILFIAAALALEVLDKKATEARTKSYEDYLAKRATQKPLEQPRMYNPSKYTSDRYKPSQLPPRPFITTTTTSKYSLEELRAMYKINPYTNLDN